MDNKIKVSIIIPAFNVQNYIENSICSVLNQTIEQIEVICIDDGSLDNTSSIIKKLCQKDRRVKYLYQTNQGAGAARNRGIYESVGKYVMFLDSDDSYATNDVIEILYNACERHNVFIAGGNHFEVVTDNEEYKVPVCPELREGEHHLQTDCIDNGTILTYLQYQGESYHWDYIYNRKFLIENNILYPNYKRNQDTPFWAKALWKAEIFYYIPRYIINYRRNIPNKNLIIDRYFADILRGYRDTLYIAEKSGNKALYKRMVEEFNFSNRNKILQNLNIDIMKVLVDVDKINNRSRFHVDLSIIEDICCSVRIGSKQRKDMDYVVGLSIKNRIERIHNNGSSLKEYFEKENIEEIVIYGMGNRGMYLYNVLTCEGMQTIKGMDIELERVGILDIMKPGDDLVNRDQSVGILISLSASDEIYMKLREYYSDIPIYSIENVLNNICDNLRNK